MVGKPYEDWIAEVRPVLLRPDTPIIQRDPHWRVLEFAATVPEPAVVGDALATLNLEEIDSQLLPAHMGAESSGARGGYVWRRFWDLRWVWMDTQLARCCNDDQRAWLLAIPILSDEVIDRVEQLDSAAQATFWSRIGRTRGLAKHRAGARARFPFTLGGRIRPRGYHTFGCASGKALYGCPP